MRICNSIKSINKYVKMLHATTLARSKNLCMREKINHKVCWKVSGNQQHKTANEVEDKRASSFASKTTYQPPTTALNLCLQLLHSAR